MSKRTTVKNPLAQALGMALRKMRHHLDKSLDDVTDDLDLSKSFYGLVESGTNYPHVNKSLALVDAFEHQFLFEAVTKILSALSIMDATGKRSVEEGNSFAGGLMLAADNLIQYQDNKLATLLSAFERTDVFESLKNGKDSADVGKVIKKEKLDEEVLSFLSSYEAYGVSTYKAQNSAFVKSIESLPSMYFPMLNGVVNQLHNLPVSIGLDQLQEWETANEDQLISLFAISRHKETIVSEENLSRYTYKYLWGRSFQCAKILFLSDKDSKEIKREFLDLLQNSIRKKGIRDRNVKQIEDRVIIRTLDLKRSQINIGDRSSKDMVKKLLRHIKLDTDHADAYWVFSLPNANVSYLAKIDNKSIEPEYAHKLQIGESLSMAEMVERTQLLQELWELSQ